MSDTESLDYLQSGFDPASLTVPRLRSILVSHDIEYPSGAKKPQLIQIFTDNVLPRSRKILAARARARRTSKGITNADLDEESTVPDEELMPPPPTPRVRSKKPTSKLKSEESESDMPALHSPAKRTPRASSKHSRASESETGPDTETGSRKPAPKLRRSEAHPVQASTPDVKPDESDDNTTTSRRRSAFTLDNPFQSGSSPMDDGRSTSSERKRKSIGHTPNRDTGSRKVTPFRKDTRQPKVDDGFHPPSSATFEIPVSKVKRLKDIEDNGVEVGEEFTPEEQLELVRDRAANGVDMLGPRRSKRQKPRGISMRGPLLVAGLTLLGGYAAWYRQEKLSVGYCGVGKDATRVIPIGIEVPDWARILVEPQCELCPPHAYCSESLRTQCEADFVLKPHPLSLAGFTPLPPTCEPDGEKVRRIKTVADRAVKELRERRAKWECGDLTDAAGLPEPTVDIDADELKKEVSKKRNKGMSEAEFEDLWNGAIGEVEGMEEVIKTDDGHRRLLSSTSLAHLPLACTIRRSFRLALARNRLQIGAVIILALVYGYARHLLKTRSADNAATPHLVSLTLDRLANQAALHAQDKEGYPENWISIGQLRDDVLRNEHSLRKREALWTKVKKVVEMNANVRASQRQARNGEISRVWEWIGAIGSLENGEKRRKSGRVSWGVYDDRSSPVSGSDGGPEMAQAKWEEGRPIY